MSRRVICLEAPDLQPLLRDGANAPPQDENGPLNRRLSRAGGSPGLQAPIALVALDPGSGSGVTKKCTLLPLWVLCAF